MELRLPANFSDQRIVTELYNLFGRIRGTKESKISLFVKSKDDARRANAWARKIAMDEDVEVIIEPSKTE